MAMQGIQKNQPRRHYSMGPNTGTTTTSSMGSSGGSQSWLDDMFGNRAGYVASVTPIQGATTTGMKGAAAGLNALTPEQSQAVGMIGKQLGGQFNAAKAANEARYNKLLQLAEQFGATQARQTNQLFDQQQANNLQQMIGAGLGNTTVLSSNQTGINSARANALADVNQQVAEQKAGIIERRTDQYPQLGMFAQLLQQPGSLNNGTLDLLKSFLGLA